ncbi:hypothetical protein Y032_0027g1597 [Ancylostoma ceylanicum]|uniref:Uncharacterized protein n=1 Tax=Ancylostoma ceylanicum TaxID=53326 RepID=A0A016UUF5_9BILA|nr:hypothetical protein Y032_0027g1597 [Ancylostoma ceylanicum]
MEDNDERDLDPFDGMWIIDSVVIFTRYEQLMNPLSNRWQEHSRNSERNTSSKNPNSILSTIAVQAFLLIAAVAEEWQQLRGGWQQLARDAARVSNRGITLF